MKLSLALALALLGAVSARQLPEGALEEEVPSELGSTILEEELRETEAPGPWEGKGLTRSHKRLRYTVVKDPQTFQEAKRTCMQQYHGNLASIHSHLANQYLRKQALSRTNQAQVWIGGTISSLGGRALYHWVDRTKWNYEHWASKNSRRSGEACVALCTAGGHWRTDSCETRLPFICQC